MQAGAAARRESPSWLHALREAASGLSTWQPGFILVIRRCDAGYAPAPIVLAQYRFSAPHLAPIALAASRQPDQPDSTFPAWLSSPLSTNPN
ncbi:hypothetical protein BN2475_690014 [Paraburkholderia ribeironis]|uniref:PH domain-containing protein n=1 Tax=Paraburkholderia ribeironis TaxID=1247936 RepID=A0A1N7SH11_9BURK|nr:hypothetical protein BN2475_690014 [Paraburkholderia ribeironis]